MKINRRSGYDNVELSPAARAKVSDGGVATAEPSPAARRVADQTSILGVPASELTPKVQAAISQLMGEVQNLRQELQQAQRRIEELEHICDRDPLIPILNRRAFVREVSRFMAFAERYGSYGSIIYFDLNGLKQINDTYGHAAGDAALQAFGEVLTANVRGSDVVGRLGGDEFGVVLAQADEALAEEKATLLSDRLSATPFEIDGQLLQLSTSWGVYSYGGADSVDDALEAADRAMYARKRSNTVSGGQ